MTRHQLIQDATNSITRRDAELLAAHVLGCDRTHILTHPEVPFDEAQHTAFAALVTRRQLGEPLQYLLGTQEFYGLPLLVTPDVLIPRPETEHLVEAVLLWATQQPDSPPLRLADIGTGSGAIVIALATHLGGADFIATDISDAALSIARQNAVTHNCAERIRFIASDLLTGLNTGVDTARPLDAIVSNPPYVPLADLPTLAIEVRAHEPHLALFGSSEDAQHDGLGVYRRLVPQALTALRQGGLLAMEFGFGQREALTALLEDWQDVRFVDDLQGIPRVVLAQRA